MLSDISPLIQICKNYQIKNLFDIGSRDGDDADFLAYTLNIDDVYIFEPNPQQFKKIITKYPKYKTFNSAISNFDGKSKFFCIKDHFDDTTKGISSLRNRIDKFYDDKADLIEVDVSKFSTFLNKNNLKNVDLVKIDVEGCTYEVLEGFEYFLDKTKIIHLEAENILYWEGQKTYKDVKDILKNLFDEVYIHEYPSRQLDSVWINKNIDKLGE